ncbi:MAG: class I SAM-dependent methyltransferase [Acidobacteriota bacterium]
MQQIVRADLLAVSVKAPDLNKKYLPFDVEVGALLDEASDLRFTTICTDRDAGTEVLSRAMVENLEHEDGLVVVHDIPGDSKRVEVKLRNPATFSPRLECETRYPSELINLILDVKGPAWLCDEITRDEDPNYVLKHLENEMRAYLGMDDFAGKRILDFGCGSGASTMLLARLFPSTEIVGVELDGELLRVARGRQRHYKVENVRFTQSPSGMKLPADLGRFDLLVMSAVYEHLLPQERTTIMPSLWSLLDDGGVLFLDQTPHRFFPLELHTTSLPLINYLPDALTLKAARRFSRRVGENDSWESLLRAGIRGATVREIQTILRHSDSKAILLEPTMSGLKDRVDLWFTTTNPDNLKTLKRYAKFALKALNSVTGIAIVPELTLAFRKEPS